MRRLALLVCCVTVGAALARADEPGAQRPASGDRRYPLYPVVSDEKRAIPSPFVDAEGREYVTARTAGAGFTVFQVTVENGETLDYGNDLWLGKGRQLEVDAVDFPTLAGTGLHSLEELRRTETITGRPVEEITRIGRPARASGTGFMASDEDILSVLAGDDTLVRRLGLTHPQLARPLFHVFNVIQCVMSRSGYAKRGDAQVILYNDRVIHLEFRGAKGWQESIFDDKVLGYWQIEIHRELDQDEVAFITREYDHLSEDQRSELIGRLSSIHTGEMVPFYIMRYGFYEGHAGYRADPIAIAMVFGLRSLEDVHQAVGGDIPMALTRHHVSGASLRLQ